MNRNWFWPKMEEIDYDQKLIKFNSFQKLRKFNFSQKFNTNVFQFWPKQINFFCCRRKPNFLYWKIVQKWIKLNFKHNNFFFLSLTEKNRNQKILKMSLKINLSEHLPPLKSASKLLCSFVQNLSQTLKLQLRLWNFNLI